MLRNVLSVITGLVICFILILVGETFIHDHLVSFPSTIKSSEELKTFINTAPAILHIYILLNYAFTTFIGGICTSLIASTKKISKAVTLGGILTGMGVLNLSNVGHPTWVIICGLFAFLPFAWFGGLIGTKLSTKKQ